MFCLDAEEPCLSSSASCWVLHPVPPLPSAAVAKPNCEIYVMQLQELSLVTSTVFCDRIELLIV